MDYDSRDGCCRTHPIERGVLAKGPATRRSAQKPRTLSTSRSIAGVLESKLTSIGFTVDCGMPPLRGWTHSRSRTSGSRHWLKLCRRSAAGVQNSVARNADGPKRHNSLGTISFAAWRLCVSQFVNPFTTRETPSLISDIRLLRKKGLTQSRQAAKKRSAEPGWLGTREYPNASRFFANTVDLYPPRYFWIGLLRAGDVIRDLAW